jgi:hypothetical protein
MSQVTSIPFNYVAGDKNIKAVLSNDSAAGNGWSLTIDNYHWGMLLFRNDAWVFYESRKANFITQDDVDAMVALISG